MVGMANPGSRPIAPASAEIATNKPRASLAVDTPHKVKEAEPAEEDESPLMQLMKETSKWMLILLLILIMILLVHRYLTRRKRNLGAAGVDS